MSLAEPVSKPSAFLTRLAVLLRKIPVVQFVLARLVSRRGISVARGESSAPPLVDQPATQMTEPVAPVLERVVDDRMAGDLSPVDPDAAPRLLGGQICLEPAAEAEPDERYEREQLIRRRWMETGIKMWNTDFNGSGRAPLNIQGRAGLLPVRRGEKISRYDTLQFKQVEHGIVCEGVVVEAPRCRK